MLTEQNKKFVMEYIALKCKNATQAAKNAGYSAKTAYSQASDLLKKPEVQEFLKEQKLRIEADIREMLVFEAQDALKIESEILHDENASDKVRLAAARDILDRAGFKSSDDVKISGEITAKNPFSELTTAQLIKIAEMGECE